MLLLTQQQSQCYVTTFKESNCLCHLLLIDCTYLVVALQDHRQFRQRYYEFLDYFRIPDGPIFLVIGGEGTCNGIANDYIGVSCLQFFFQIYNLHISDGFYLLICLHSTLDTN